MKISAVKNTMRVGEIKIGDIDYRGSSHVFHKKALEITYDKNFPNDLKRKHLSLIYIFTVNGEIFKIGQSSGKSGISGCLGFYLKSGQDDPGINRFSVNIFIREEIKKGNKVEVYMVYMDLVKVKVPGLFEDEVIDVPISAKGMENIFMKQYYSKEKKYPRWNYQENAESLPSDVSDSYGIYKSKRAKGRS